MTTHQLDSATVTAMIQRYSQQRDTCLESAKSAADPAQVSTLQRLAEHYQRCLLRLCPIAPPVRLAA